MSKKDKFLNLFTKEMICDKIQLHEQVYVEMEVYWDYTFSTENLMTSYLQMIKNFAFSQWQEHFYNQLDGVFQHLWWFQDGVPAHHLKAVRHGLREMFANRVVALHHDVELLPKSPDMTFFSFWGYMSSQVFGNTSCNMQNSG